MNWVLSHAQEATSYRGLADFGKPSARQIHGIHGLGVDVRLLVEKYAYDPPRML